MQQHIYFWFLFVVFELGKAFDIQSYVLGPEESSKLYPLMNVSDVYGTLYSPDDGTVDPAGYCTALTRAASKLGAKVGINQSRMHCMIIMSIA